MLLRAFEHKTARLAARQGGRRRVKAIEDLYHNTGYIFAQVEPELVERADRVADVSSTSPRATSSRSAASSSRATSAPATRCCAASSASRRGGWCRSARLKNSVNKVNQLGYFKLNEDNPVEYRPPDREKKTVDLTFNGRESDRTELHFGGGWSELDGFFGQFSMQTKNFLGRGESLGVSVQTGKVRDFYDLSYSVPWRPAAEHRRPAYRTSTTP